MKKGCGQTLAKGHWWGYCGETDMGQTLPVLCTECGGEYILAKDAEEEKKLIKSVQTKDQDILMAIRQLYLDGKNFDLDPCFSTGTFYKGIKEPKYKLDKNPQRDDVTKNDVLAGLPYKTNSLNGIVFDPPFMFGIHGPTHKSLMSERFTMFNKWENLEVMYKASLAEFYRILKKKGVVAFKCQDYTDSKTTLTHCFVHNWAIKEGFKAEDLFIKIATGGRIWNKKLTQRHARKYHCYWFVFKK